MIRAIFPSLNIGLMGQRKAQFSENWKTHFLCFVVTKLSTDKRVHSINSGVIHLTIAPLCFPLGAAWKYALRGPFAQMSAQMKRGKRTENVKQDAENLKRGALCRPRILLTSVQLLHRHKKRKGTFAPSCTLLSAAGRRAARPQAALQTAADSSVR